MANVLKISEAASLALHTMVLLAANPGRRMSIRQVASMLHASQAHLAKVLQRLVKVGLANSTRGPKGGFTLAKRPNLISLLDVYEAIDGPLGTPECLLGTPVCDGTSCILGGLLEATNRQFRTYMAAARLSDLTGVYRGQPPRHNHGGTGRH